MRRDVVPKWIASLAMFSRIGTFFSFTHSLIVARRIFKSPARCAYLYRYPPLWYIASSSHWVKRDTRYILHQKYWVLTSVQKVLKLLQRTQVSRSINAKVQQVDSGQSQCEHEAQTAQCGPGHEAHRFGHRAPAD